MAVGGSNETDEEEMAFLAGGGALGELIRTFDWAATPLGAISAWPQSLKTITGMLLLSPVPIVLLWGEDGIMIYNDAYSVFAGRRHPQLLGSKVREGWVEVADFNDNVMKVGLSGRTLRYTDQQLTLDRHGRPESVWMNLDYSPVLDESGRPAGVVAIVVETTQKVLAARRLEESERRLRALTNATSDIIYRASPDWSELRQLDGRGFLADTSQPDRDWMTTYLLPEDLPAVEAAIREAVRSKGVFQLEHRIRNVGGEPAWVSSRAVPTLDNDGNIVEWFGAATDITERKRAEERRDALIRLSAELQNLTGAADVAFAASEMLGKVLGATRAGYAVLDDDANSLSVLHEWNDHGRDPTPLKVDLDPFGSLGEDLRRNDLAVVSDVYRDPRLASQGDRLVERGIRSFVNLPITDKNKTAAIFYVHHADVRRWTVDDLYLIREVASRTRTAIERRLAEQEVRKLAASLERQVDERTRERDRVWRNTQDLSVILDLDHIFVAVNPATTATLGWDEEELIGRSIYDFIDPDDGGLTSRSLHDVVSGSKRPFENRCRCRDEGYRWISWVATLDGDLIYASGRDITLEKEASEALKISEEALRQSQKMEAVGQLTGGLAHDFNNILAGISGSLDLMQTRITQGRIGELDRYINAAQGATKRAAALTHRLLAFARRQTLEPKPTNINRLVADMEDLIRRSVGPEITVETVAAGGLWNTLVDAGQLENALLNLCLNARDAMVNGGHLIIETANRWLDERTARERDLPAGQYVSLCVSDNGTGMPPDVVARAFDPFFTTKPMGQGTGLGLSMIYGFARQSGGQARIYSEVGKGTMVCVYLPRHLGELEGPEISADAVEAPRAVSGQTILVVDDEPLVRMFVVEVLEELGYAALEAHDGSSGMKILSSDVRIDLLITDVGLPNGMNGRQLADAARSLRNGLKVLFITGYAENALLNHGHLEKGMHAMTKPLAMDALAMRIRDLIGE